METKSFEFEGELITLTEDEMKPHIFRSGIEYLGSRAEFVLKDKKVIAGTIIKIFWLHPTDFSDIRLMSKFLVETENGDIIELKFTDIESYKLTCCENSFSN